MDRVRAHTAPHVNRRIDEAAEARIRQFEGATEAEISRRIEQLDREWDTERVLETNASALAFMGLVTAMRSNRKWLLVPSVVLPFLFLHAVQGWCPPLPILRRLGIRTRKEIDAEKFALKALRGDFKDIGQGSSGATALHAARS
jgi:hypothetical protein